MPGPAPTPTKPMATHDGPPDPSFGTIPYGDLPASIPMAAQPVSPHAADISATIP